MDRAAGGQALLLVLDDLHAWDAASLAAVAPVARGLDGRRVLLVGTARTIDGGEPAAEAELEGLGALARTIPLHGLSVGDVGALVDRRVEVETCRLHGVDPPTWLADVLPRIAAARPSDYPDLLPQRWKELRQRLAAA